jgi:hypothetical protein
MKFGEWLYHSVWNLLSSRVPSTLKIQNCNVGSFIASLLHVDSRLTVKVNRLLKTEHSDPEENQDAEHQKILHSKELHNLFFIISLICDKSVTTQNLAVFRRSFERFRSAIISYECNDDTTAFQRRVLQTAL